MTNNQNWEDDFDSNDDDLESLPKKLRAQIKRQQKELEQRDEELSGLRKQVRQTSVKDILKEVGVNPKVAKFALNDLEDVTKESVTEWVNENGELFGITLGEATEEAAPKAPATPQGMNQEQANALAGINQFVAPDTAGVVLDPAVDLEKAIKATQDPEELKALLGMQTKAFDIRM